MVKLFKKIFGRIQYIILGIISVWFGIQTLSQGTMPLYRNGWIGATIDVHGGLAVFFGIGFLVCGLFCFYFLFRER